MSQQYGPPGQGPAGQGGPGPQYGQPLPPPGQGGWGPGPRGYPPGQFRPPGRSRHTMYAVVGGGVVALVLIVLGVVLLLTSGGKDQQPTAAGSSLTPDPVGTLYTPSTPSPTEPVVTKGPNDKGVEVGNGVWFTPAKGWIKDPEKHAGANYLLPEPGRKGAIDGWFWARQTTLMGAKAFADHLVDVESNNLQHVVIGKGHPVRCPSAALKACYATNYSAVVPVKGKKPVVFSGFIQAFEDKNGMTTATDAALQKEVYPAHKQEVLNMNGTLVRSI
jgi:hypothetical protein